MIGKRAILYTVAGAAVLAAFVYSRMGRPAGGQSWVGYMAEQTGAAVVDSVDGVLSGVAYGVGDRIGLERTNETECERAIREGRTWDASFACPAGTFIKSLFN